MPEWDENGRQKLFINRGKVGSAASACCSSVRGDRKRGSMNPAEHSEASRSESPAAPEVRHRDTVDRFVRFWGDMASNWGINRTMAQIHALLYCSEEPLNTDDIMQRLDISRGNANMNLRSLTEWDLVDKVHLAGSRKDFYVAEKDVWHITAQIIRERERREIKPVKQQLRELRDHLRPASAESCDDLDEQDALLCRRIQNLVELMEVFEGFFEALLPLVKERNASTIRELIQIARSLEAPAHEREVDRRD